MANRKNRVSAAELAQTDTAPPAEAEPASDAPVAAAPRRRRNAAAPRPERAPAQPARSTRSVQIAPLPTVHGTPPPLRQQNYLPDAKKHMSQMGAVATGAFICVVDGERISVRMGAPRATIPKDIQRLMLEAGVGFGLASPPAKAGAVVVAADDEDPEPGPRARRTERSEKGRDRTFKPLRAMPLE